MAINNQSGSGPQLPPAVSEFVRILVAEDPFINTFLRTMLQRQGYRVTTADPRQGSNLMRSGSQKFDLVITNTPALFEDCGEDFALLYIAASPDPEVVRPFRVCRTLRKPFGNEQLRETVDTLLRIVVL